MKFRILLAFAIPAFSIVLGLLLKGVDRIITARMQRRVGPPITQPFNDVEKLLAKESIVPKNAVKWMFNLMPGLAFVSTIAILLYVPLGMAPVLEGYGDLILVIYLLMLPSLALVIGGFASSSPYASVGAQREMVKMMSYEVPLAIVSISIVWLLYSSNINDVFSFAVISGNPVWGFAGPLGYAGLSMLFLSLLFVMAGELGRVPFDVSEADSEIAGGIFTEYSGRNLALFYLADAVKIVAVPSIIIALFLPYGISNLFGLSGVASWVIDFVFYLAKLFVLVLFGSTILRVTTGRLRINQVVSAYWGHATVVSLIGLFLVMTDTAFR